MKILLNIFRGFLAAFLAFSATVFSVAAGIWTLITKAPYLQGFQAFGAIFLSIFLIAFGAFCSYYIGKTANDAE